MEWRQNSTGVLVEFQLGVFKVDMSYIQKWKCSFLIYD